MPNRYRVSGHPHTQQGYPVAPYPPAYVPHGTGLEPAAAPGPPGMPDGWFRLWNRIPGGYAARSLAVYQLQRSGFRDPDTIQVRPSVNSAVVTAGPGNNGLVWNWDTLTVITGIRAFIDPDGPASAFQFSAVVKAGSDGGYIFGSDNNPSHFPAINCAVGDVGVLPLAPTSARPNNSWTGSLIGDAGIDPTRVSINFYGLSMWAPEGQIL